MTNRRSLTSESTMAGLVAGLALLAFDMMVSVVTGETVWSALRMKGAILLGRGALDPGYPWGLTLKFLWLLASERSYQASHRRAMARGGASALCPVEVWSGGI